MIAALTVIGTALIWTAVACVLVWTLLIVLMLPFLYLYEEHQKAKKEKNA